MDPRHLDELARVEATYWWHVAKRALLEDLLHRFAPPPGLLVEGGVGAGLTLRACRDLGYEVAGLDRMPEAGGHAAALGLTEVHVQDLHDPWPFEAGRARAVVLLDVLEHLEDPVSVLRHAAAALEPEGVVVVSVPAVPALFGPWDRALGHLRRYTRGMLAAEAGEAGLTVRWISAWNAFSLLPATLVRGVDRILGRQPGVAFPEVPEVVNRGLVTLAAAERGVLGIHALPLGLSLAAVLAAR
ncbi:MAG: class I SAM-dependent methyltransferase [Deltaproteobacteria bacterium]|nr:class I SAM-dependent methyltransferase [Deltaproteobacteria bacterium]